MKLRLDEEDWKPVFDRLDQLKKELLMATQEQADQIVSRLNTVTNKMADELTALRGQIKAQGLPQAAEDSLLAALDTNISKLEALGADPSNPVPLDSTSTGSGSTSGTSSSSTSSNTLQG